MNVSVGLNRATQDIEQGRNEEGSAVELCSGAGGRI